MRPPTGRRAGSSTQRLLIAAFVESLLFVCSVLNRSTQAAVIENKRDLQVRRETSTANLIAYILDQTDSMVRPNVYGPPVIVACDIFVQTIGPLSVTSMDYEMEMYFHMKWRDHRLSYTNQTEPVLLNGEIVQNIWTPDLFFLNAEHSRIHDVLTNNNWVSIYPNGTVYFSARISLRLSCPMSLKKYPMDEPVCPLQITSYSQTKENMNLIWANSEPIQMNDNLILPEYVLKKHEHNSSCSLSYTVGDYSCLDVKFSFKRHSKSHILKDYVVSSFIVIIAWMSFWIHRDAIPARITLGVTTLLTMTTQLGNSSTGTATVSYLKAIDIWNVFCMVMVFAALMEFAMVNVLSRREKAAARAAPKKKGAGQPDITLSRHAYVVGVDNAPAESTERNMGEPHANNNCLLSLFVTSQGLDKLARFLYPLIVFAFNIGYWNLVF